MDKETKRLTAEDWGLIAPGRLFPLGNTEIKIKPLSIEEIFDVLLLTHDALRLAIKKGITLVNWHEKENISELKSLFVSHLPQVVTMASDLDGEDFRKLPGEFQINLIAEIITENLSTVESATKNSDALMAGLNSAKTMQAQVSQPESS